jgi:hypothetical protein
MQVTQTGLGALSLWLFELACPQGSSEGKACDLTLNQLIPKGWVRTGTHPPNAIRLRGMAEVVILLGAGATLADALGRPQRDRPPLDRGFFKGLQRAGQSTATDVQTVRVYLRDRYSQDLFEQETDSFEQILAIVYADIYGGSNQAEAEGAFRAMLRILHRQVIRTTNSLDPKSKSRLYRMIVRLFENGVSPDDIVIITYNYDLQAEKVLRALAATSRWQRLLSSPIWSFPDCYGLPSPTLSNSPTNQPRFERTSVPGGIALLKLHGSLNWFSKHISRTPSASTLLNPTRELRITPRSQLQPEMTFRGVRQERRTRSPRRMYTFPIVVPPVVNKAAILHADVRGVWDTAQEALETAREIVVFGYSCPVTDSETANMISRSCRRNVNIKDFHVVNPDPGVFSRYVGLTSLGRLSYYRHAEAFIDAM